MSVTTIGFTEFEAKLDGLSKEVLEECDFVVNDSAKLWEQLAKESAPVTNGFLRGEILGSPVEFLTAEVVSPKFYSAYQEWGTGERVSIPTELLAYAAQFRGKKKVKGIFPHPFFFVQKPIVEKFLSDKLT